MSRPFSAAVIRREPAQRSRGSVSRSWRSPPCRCFSSGLDLDGRDLAGCRRRARGRRGRSGAVVVGGPGAQFVRCWPVASRCTLSPWSDTGYCAPSASGPCLAPLCARRRGVGHARHSLGGVSDRGRPTPPPQPHHRSEREGHREYRGIEWCSGRYDVRLERIEWVVVIRTKRGR